MIAFFILAHLVADFMLQPYWLVVRKRRWDGLLIHGGLVLACMLALPLLEPRALALWPWMLGIAAVHTAVDWWKVHRADRLFAAPIVPFLLDQALHLATIVVALSLALPAAEVWLPGAVPGAPLALDLAALVIAACAAPIGVMVWLDPGFAHAALSGRARLRGLAIGGAVVLLALSVGSLALPATLLGFALLSGRPASAHPLDTPRGMLAVLCVAALAGALAALV